MNRSAWVFALLVPIFAAAPAPAQDAIERYNELQRVPEMVNDPDPLMRIVNFEAIVAENDQLKTEVAIQTAMGIDDARLRALATKTYLSTVGDVTFAWTLPELVSAKLANGPDKLSKTEAALYDDHLSRSGLVPVRFSGIDNGNAFQVEQYGAIFQAAEGRVLGDRLVFRAIVQFRGGTRKYCNFDFAPTAELTLEGTMSCEDYWWGGPMGIKAEMF
ncbi:hypothetical protein [Rhodospirillaceae bacterium SYSU D60014]|uniref:hypothetical protein n=1 Tax=Virgifigura deserti TaxID=2268457 RepID=UPI000E6737D1